jgi:hypothetical protein
LKTAKKYIIEKELIELCKIQIIHKAGFDDHQVLSHKDFEYLCYVIEEKSKINLSKSTLKRIWKNEYDRIPQDSTLDALAQFIDYESWNAFKRAVMKEKESKTESLNQKSHLKILKKKSLLLYLILPLFIVVLTTVIIKQYKKHNRFKTINPENIIFRSYGTISTGVPNTVVFEYNIDDIDADSFFIQQSWDTNRRVKIQKKHYYQTDIYYYPDYHVAKLIANNKVIKEHDVYINTGGWLPYVTYGYFTEKPIYLKVDSLIRNNTLSVSLQDLQKNNIDLNKNWVVHFRISGAFKRISSDNFTLKTKVRIKNEAFQPCPHFYLMINCRDASMDFPLVKKGCENIVYLKFSDLAITGKQNDLSFAGCDLEKWQELVINNVEKKVTVFLNGKKIFQNSYTKSGGVIAGFDYYFNSIGEIDYVSLYDKDNQLIYEDRFENTKQ